MEILIDFLHFIKALSPEQWMRLKAALGNGKAAAFHSWVDELRSSNCGQPLLQPCRTANACHRTVAITITLAENGTSGEILFSERTDLPKWLLSQPIAHRGLHDNSSGVPENSLAAIRACLAAGCPVEIDVRVLADGHLAVFHDRTLFRMTGQNGSVGTLRRAETKTYTLLGTDEHVPLLSEVLALVDGSVPLLIEIKCEGPFVRRVTTALIREMAGYNGFYAVQSFNPSVLRLMQRLAPHTPRGLLTGWKFGTSFAWIAKPDMICQEVQRLEDASVQRARRRGVPVLAWVVRDAATLQMAVRLADNYIYEEGPYRAEPAGATRFST